MANIICFVNRIKVKWNHIHYKMYTVEKMHSFVVLNLLQEGQLNL